MIFSLYTSVYINSNCVQITNLAIKYAHQLCMIKYGLTPEWHQMICVTDGLQL